MKYHIVDTEIYVKKFILEYSHIHNNTNILRSINIIRDFMVYVPKYVYELSYDPIIFGKSSI